MTYLQWFATVLLCFCIGFGGPLVLALPAVLDDIQFARRVGATQLLALAQKHQRQYVAALATCVVVGAAALGYLLGGAA
jgi:hypothetical protein